MVARSSTRVAIRVSGRTCAGIRPAVLVSSHLGTARTHPWASSQLGCSQTWWLLTGSADGASAPDFLSGGTLAQAVAVAERLTARWDEALVNEWFADNMALDAPLQFRRETLETLLRATGPLDRDDTVAPKAPAPTEATWWMAGREGARVRVDLFLSPHPEPKIQMLNWTRVDRVGQTDTDAAADLSWPPVEPARTQINPRSVSTNI